MPFGTVAWIYEKNSAELLEVIVFEGAGSIIPYTCLNHKSKVVAKCTTDLRTLALSSLPWCNFSQRI